MARNRNKENRDEENRNEDNGDEEFESLVRRQSHFVFRVAYAILRNTHDAEDAAQETFLKLYRNRSWRGMDNERAFLARTAGRVAIDRIRIARPERSQATDAEPESELASTSPSPEQQAIAANQQSSIHRIIDALPEDLRQPLALSAIDELNSREIAAILDIPEGTVRTRLMRARQLLKQKLATLTESRYAR